MRIDLGNEPMRKQNLIKMCSHLGSQLKREDFAKFQQYFLMLMRLSQIDVDVCFVDVLPDLLNDFQKHDFKLC